MESGKRPKALITGASSGIGRAFAIRFAEKGYDLTLVSRRRKLLEELCAELKESCGINAEYIIAELSDDTEVKKLEKLVKADLRVEVLINNAGYARMSPFLDDSIDAQVDMIKVHDIASVRLVHAALPGMLSKGKGTIINVSSIGAFVVGGSHNMLYYASKLFLVSFTETLHVDFHKKGIKVQALCPGFTVSDFHKRMGYPTDHPVFRTFRMMTSDKVVDISLKDLDRGKIVSIPGINNKINAFFARFMPRRMFYWFIADVFRGMKRRYSEEGKRH